MGFLKRQRQAIKDIEEKAMEDYLKEIDEVNKKHKLMLVPIIGRYRAQFEVQKIPEEKKTISEEKEEFSKENVEPKQIGETK